MALVDEHTRTQAFTKILDANARPVEGSFDDYTVGSVHIHYGETETRYATTDGTLLSKSAGTVAVEAALRLGFWRRVHTVKATVTTITIEGLNDSALRVSDASVTRGGKPRNIEGTEARNVAARALGTATDKLARAAFRFSSALS